MHSCHLAFLPLLAFLCAFGFWNHLGTCLASKGTETAADHPCQSQAVSEFGAGKDFKEVEAGVENTASSSFLEQQRISLDLSPESHGHLEVFAMQYQEPADGGFLQEMQVPLDSSVGETEGKEQEPKEQAFIQQGQEGYEGSEADSGCRPGRRLQHESVPRQTSMDPNHSQYQAEPTFHGEGRRAADPTSSDVTAAASSQSIDSHRGRRTIERHTAGFAEGGDDIVGSSTEQTGRVRNEKQRPSSTQRAVAWAHSSQEPCRKAAQCHHDEDHHSGFRMEQICHWHSKEDRKSCTDVQILPSDPYGDVQREMSGAQVHQGGDADSLIEPAWQGPGSGNNWNAGFRWAVGAIDGCTQARHPGDFRRRCDAYGGRIAHRDGAEEATEGQWQAESSSVSGVPLANESGKSDTEAQEDKELLRTLRIFANQGGFSRASDEDDKHDADPWCECAGPNVSSSISKDKKEDTDLNVCCNTKPNAYMFSDAKVHVEFDFQSWFHKWQVSQAGIEDFLSESHGWQS